VTLRHCGQGPPVLVIHGGPGFDHGYLFHALKFLQDDYELLFYDQLGSAKLRRPPTRFPSLKTIASELVEIVSDWRGPALRIVAHSWGALVFAAAARSNPQLFEAAICGGIFINPVPLNRAAFDASYQAFVRRIPLHVKLKVYCLSVVPQSGVIVMKLLWPYYTGSQAKSDPPGFRLNLRTYRAVLLSLGDYDCTLDVNICRRFSLLLGGLDATPRATISDLIACCKTVSVIEQAGHFPLQDQPEEWKQRISALLAAS